MSAGFDPNDGGAPNRAGPQRWGERKSPTNEDLGERTDPLPIKLLGGACLVAGFLFAGPRIFAWAMEPMRLRVEEKRVLVTAADLRQLDRLLGEWAADHGAPPKHLRALLEDRPGGAPYLADAHWLRDAWTRPIEYAVQDGAWTLVSYGRDGRPGGDGVDADLRHP